MPRHKKQFFSSCAFTDAILGKKSARQLDREIDESLQKARIPEKSRASLASDPLAITLQATSAMPKTGRVGPEKVFVSEVWKKVGKKIGMSLEEFKRWLTLQLMKGNLSLARADAVGGMDPAKVSKSEILHMGASFHFIIDPSSSGWY